MKIKLEIGIFLNNLKKKNYENYEHQLTYLKKIIDTNYLNKLDKDIVKFFFEMGNSMKTNTLNDDNYFNFYNELIKYSDIILIHKEDVLLKNYLNEIKTILRTNFNRDRNLSKLVSLSSEIKKLNKDERSNIRQLLYNYDFNDYLNNNINNNTELNLQNQPKSQQNQKFNIDNKSSFNSSKYITPILTPKLNQTTKVNNDEIIIIDVNQSKNKPNLFASNNNKQNSFIFKKQTTKYENKPLYKFYNNCKELSNVIPYEKINDIDNNYIVKQAILLWYIAIKYTNKFINYINEQDIKLMLSFYEHFGDKGYHNDNFYKIYLLLNNSPMSE